MTSVSTIATLALALFVHQLPGRSVPMPTQPQSLEYFAGTWTFTRLGAESAVAPGPGTGTLTFTKTADGKLHGASDIQIDGGGRYREQMTVAFDAAARTLAWSEERPGGVKLSGIGDWSSPLAIRFTFDQFKAGAATYRIKRVFSVISASSFSMTEEVSTNGGPFVRLGNAVYVKQ